MEKKRTTQHRLALKVIYVFATFVMVLGNFVAAVPQMISAANGDISFNYGDTLDASKTTGTVDSGSEVAFTLNGTLASLYPNVQIAVDPNVLQFDKATTVTKNGLSSTQASALSVSGDKKTITVGRSSKMPIQLYFTATNTGANSVTTTLSASMMLAGGAVDKTVKNTLTVNKPAPKFNTTAYPSQHQGNDMNILTQTDGTPWTNGGAAVIAIQSNTSLAAGETLTLSFPEANLAIDAAQTLRLQGQTASDLGITTTSNGSVTIKNNSSAAIALDQLPIALKVTGAVSSGVVVVASRSSITDANYATLVVPGGANPYATTFNPASFGVTLQAAVPDPNYNNGVGTYLMANQPLFYSQQTDPANKNWYAIIDSGNGQGKDADIYKAIAGLQSTWGSSSTISDKATTYFLPFQQIDATGMPSSAQLPFEPGKTYTLKKYDPVSGAPTTFRRLGLNYLSGMYYLPDGVPTFSFDSDGTLKVNDDAAADGRAVPGQWTVADNHVTAKTFKVKRVKIVDEAGQPVKGATVNFTDMKAITGSDGSGEIVPKTWGGIDANGNSVTSTLTGAAAGFYWGKGTGDGTQQYQGMTLAGSDANKYFIPHGSFNLELDKTTDNLKVSNDDVGAKIQDVSYSDQWTKGGAARTEETVVLTVKDRTKLTDAQKNFSIKKTDTATGSALPGAKFSVTDKSTTDPVAATTTAATGSDGLAGVTVPATSSTPSRIVAVQEVTAPDGYVANKTTYYAKWELGSGFTAVGTDASATPTDKKSADDQVSVDSDGHLVFADKKLSKAQTTLSIKKTAQDGTTALAGSKFYVTEPATDKASDPLAAMTTDATGNDGLVSVALPTGSTTATRVVKVQETQSHSGYQLDPHVYYAKWVQGSGFTAVTAGDVNGSDPSDSTNPTAKSAANAVIDDEGNLVIKNNPTSSFSGDTGYRWRYVNAAGQGINGAALPATPGVNIMSNGEAYDGLAGLILNPNSNASDFMQAASVDVSIVPGQAFDNGDSSMMTAKEVSGDATNGAGYGVVQPLWTTKPLPVSISSGDLYDQINNAVTNGYLLTSPLLGYSIQNTAMKQRAAASTDAYHYYVNDSNVKLYAPAAGGDIAADSQSNGSTLTNAVTTSGKTASVVLNKVKLLKLKDTNGDPLSGDTATFKDSAGKDVLTATTGADGTGELIPTNKDVFAWPSGSLKLDKITDASGNAIDIPATGGELKLDAKADTLSLASPVANSAEITADSDGNAGQVVQYTLKAQSNIKLNVVNENGNIVAGNDHLAGSTFKVTRVDTGDVYTGTSDADGNISIDLPNPPTDSTYFKIEQTKATQGYSKIISDTWFRWSKAKGIISVGPMMLDDVQYPQASIPGGGAYQVNSDGSMTAMLPQRIVFRQNAMFDRGKAVGDGTSSTGDYTLQEYSGNTPVGAAFNVDGYDVSGDWGYYYAGVVLNTQSPDKVRTFKLSVKDPLTASVVKPYRPLPAGTSYFLKWSGAKGVISVSKTADGTFSQITPDSVVSVVNSPDTTTDDPEQSIITLGFDRDYTINTTAAGASGSPAAVNGAKVLLSGAKLYNTPASADGKITLTGSQIYQNVAGGAAGTLPANGTTLNLKLLAQGAGTKSAAGTYPYNSVDTHDVTFTFAKGFTIPATNTDNQVTAEKTTGDLNLNFRRYILRAQDLADPTSNVNATFAFAVKDDTGKTVTRTLTTDQSGTVQLPDPLTLFGGDSTPDALQQTAGRTYTATLTQTDGPETYQSAPSAINLTYTAADGYKAQGATIGTAADAATDYVTQAPQAQALAPSGAPYIWRHTDSDVTTQTVATFMGNGGGVGTQILYTLPKVAADVSFVNVANGNNLNFGKHDFSTSAQTYGVEKSDSTNLAGTVPTTVMANSGLAFWGAMSTPGDEAFGFQVQQTGSVPSGWSVNMTAGNLAVDGRADASTAGSTLSLTGGQMQAKRTSDGQVSFNPFGTTTGADHTIALGEATDGDDVVMKSSDSVFQEGENVPGIYTAYWNSKNIKLSVPANAGAIGNAVYAAPLTWTRVINAPDGNN